MSMAQEPDPLKYATSVAASILLFRKIAANSANKLHYVAKEYFILTTGRCVAIKRNGVRRSR